MTDKKNGNITINIQQSEKGARVHVNVSYEGSDFIAVDKAIDMAGIAYGKTINRLEENGWIIDRDSAYTNDR